MSDLDIVNNYYRDNAKHLKEVSNNIVMRLNKRPEELSDTLITNSYMYVIERLEKFSEYIQSTDKKGISNIQGVVTRFMQYQVRWHNTDFKKEFVYESKTRELEDYMLEDRADDLDEVLHNDYQTQQKLNHIEGQKRKLTVSDRILYDLSITGPYNTSGKLAKHIGVNRTGTYNMIKDLKIFLKEGFEENN